MAGKILKVSTEKMLKIKIYYFWEFNILNREIREDLSTI